MAHGRGIYMSDTPGACKRYGPIMILSRVLYSSTDTLKTRRHGGDDNVYVIRNVKNILPYCVLSPGGSMLYGAWRLMIRLIH